MPLPDPLPDNPNRWEGWRSYNSKNPYERLGFEPGEHPPNEEIERNCRTLLVWWQKKLPLKNQPSNPLAQMLRGGIDEAPKLLAEARSTLLDPAKRVAVDAELNLAKREAALAEFLKFFQFTTSSGFLSEEDEIGLIKTAMLSGFSEQEAKEIIDNELVRHGAQRKIKELPKPPEPAPAPVVHAPAGVDDPFANFQRILRMTKLEDGEMTDGQRDAMCNIGESMGLTGGQAEDLIDEYLDEANGMPVAPIKPVPKPVVAQRPVAHAAPKLSEAAAKAKTLAEIQVEQDFSNYTSSPDKRAAEKQKYPAFSNAPGVDMILVPTGIFMLGSNSADAAPNEAPMSQVAISCFYASKFPITNAQYEKFEPSHRAKRAPWADDYHPVVYVSHSDAQRFCEWLCSREKKRYRLLTEAEWEYAARGTEGRRFPWGDELDGGDRANFADAQTTFAWREVGVNDGYPNTSPIGAFPRGISPHGLLDMSGNVWEWCRDFFGPYSDKKKFNPRGPQRSAQRIYRGGSWKSRIGNLRGAARGFNLPTFSSNDVGFRIACEVD